MLSRYVLWMIRGDELPDGAIPDDAILDDAIPDRRDGLGGSQANPSVSGILSMEVAIAVHSQT